MWCSDQRVRLAGLVFCLLVFAFGSTHASAQEIADNGSDELASYKLEQISVTAQKKEENLQDVPESISVISAQDLEDAHVSDTTELYQVVPNFFSASTGNRAFSSSLFKMRGMGNLYEGDSAVSIYIDDMPVLDSHFFSFPLDNVERIEVLRGPQGSLYGMNTEAGVINIVTKQPGNDLAGTAGVEYGSYDRYKSNISASGPLVKDQLFAGISLLAEAASGDFDNKFSGNDLNGWRTFMGGANLRWIASERMEIRFGVTADHNDDGQWLWAVKDRNAYNSIWKTGLDKYDVSIDDEGFARNQSDKESLRVKYSTPWGAITSITSRMARTDDVGGDLDCTSLDYMSFTQAQETQQYSQEVRVNSPDDETKFSWVAGLFFAKKDSDYEQIFDFGKDYFMSYDQITNATYEDETYAVFGQSTYRLIGGKLGLTAGLRYEHDTRYIQRKRVYSLGGMTMALNNSLLGRMASQYSGEYALDTSFDSLLPRFALDYRVNPALMIYFSAALGYKAGGFSSISNDPDKSSYDPEYAWTYEVGIKSTLLQERMMLNLSCFYTKVDDYQDRIVVDNIVTMKNAAKATIYGGEAEVRYKPLSGLDLIASLGLLHAEYDDYRDMSSGVAVSFDGNAIALTPDMQYHLAAQYRFESGLYFRADVTGVGELYFTRENADRLSQGAYEIVKAKVGYETELMDLYVFVDNLLDEYYFTQLNNISGYMVPGVHEAGFVGAPRIFGVIGKIRF
ncbi:TonB-dependent receptor [Desulfarculus baarsii]